MANNHLGLGKLHHGTGEGPEARENPTSTTTMYREMDMRVCLQLGLAEPRTAR